MPDIAEKVVLDLETKKSLDEVGKRGERNLELLGVSIVSIYSYREDSFKTFTEKELDKLLPYLQKAELVVGFNIKGFDYPVLQPYLNFDLKPLNTLDMFEQIQSTLGFRIGLNSLAQATLNIGKTGTGLDALRYFRQGKLKELTQYCQNDVLITRQLYEYGRKFGHLLYRRGMSFETIPASWAETRCIEDILQEAFDKRMTLEIEYSSPSNNAGAKHARLIDIYAFEQGRIIAYCHLRSDLRTFNIRRTLAAKSTENKYIIPDDFNLRKFKAKQKIFNTKKNIL